MNNDELRAAIERCEKLLARMEPDGLMPSFPEEFALVETLKRLAPQLLSLAKQAMERPVAGMTKDGVEVRVGDRIWSAHKPNYRAYALPRGEVDGYDAPLEAMYSTESAARAAGAKGGEDGR